MSAVHRVHPDSKRYVGGYHPVNAILYDDCDRCDEQAV